MGAGGLLAAFATVAVCSAFIGAILEYVAHAIHLGHKKRKPL